MRYLCSVCLKPERFNEMTGSTDVEPQEIWIDKPLPEENAYRWSDKLKGINNLRTMVFAHNRCAAQFEEFIELRDTLNDNTLSWKEKQQAICRSLTKLTDFESRLPQAISPDWRPEFVVPEDYYNY